MLADGEESSIFLVVHHRYSGTYIAGSQYNVAGRFASLGARLENQVIVFAFAWPNPGARRLTELQ